MNEVEIEQFIRNDFETKYLCFMGVQTFPQYEIKFDLLNPNFFSGNTSVPSASANYNIHEDKHDLIIRIDVTKCLDVLYHEFTHILDYGNYVRGQDINNLGLNGFSEYHATQVELQYLLGMSHVWDCNMKYSMDQSVLGFESLSSYLSNKLDIIKELFSCKAIYKDVRLLGMAIGTVFNLLGAVSICKNFCFDYDMNIENQLEKAIDNDTVFSKFKVFFPVMIGRLDESEIMKCVELYVFSFIDLFRRASI